MHLFPGTRVRVFDPRLYVDDRATPPSVTVRPATVVRWYGRRADSTPTGAWAYPNLVDVEFDHRPGVVSHGHFADSVFPLERFRQ